MLNHTSNAKSDRKLNIPNINISIVTQFYHKTTNICAKIKVEFDQSTIHYQLRTPIITSDKYNHFGKTSFKIILMKIWVGSVGQYILEVKLLKKNTSRNKV